jgi:septal ring factor EnvC (AmiA/AmiB activator)
MDSWIWWIATCVISLYFVMLLLDFNKPSKKLMEQIDHQETRRRDMEQRHVKVQEEVAQIKTRQDDLDLQLEDLEQRRKDLLLEANKRRMLHIEAGPFNMGGSEDDSPPTSARLTPYICPGSTSTPFR